ncbi:MAG: phytanoyl-CoA dioxygenase family protein [Candidatus Sumerlaeaceae bacterium]
MSIDLSALPTEEDVRFFEENGYWFGPKVVSDERLEKYRAAMDRVYNCEYETGTPPWSSNWKPGDDPKALRKMDNCHWSSLSLRELALDETIGAMAARLARTDQVRLWHDQLLYKPGGGKASGNVGWHQDYYYWQCCDSPNMLTAWVAFDDVTVENGAMMVVARSHRWGMMNENDFFNTNIDNIQDQIKIPEGDKLEIVPCVPKAGHLSFHHSLTIHGSGANQTDKPRRSLVVHMMDGKCRYRKNSPSEEHMNSLLLRGDDGDPFAGEFFPLLYSERQLVSSSGSSS